MDVQFGMSMGVYVRPILVGKKDGRGEQRVEQWPGNLRFNSSLSPPDVRDEPELYTVR